MDFRSKTIMDCLGYLKPTLTLWINPISAVGNISFFYSFSFSSAVKLEKSFPNVEMPLGLRVLVNHR